MKKFVLICFPILFATIGYGQTIFTYGKNTVSKSEFVRAFNKNPMVGINRKEALKEYLDLYMNFKLKVKAAYDAKLQDDATQVAELNNFKLQIADNIINEEAQMGKLVQEAFERSQKDIHIAQVFIQVPEGGDTTVAYKTITEAYNQLQSGKDFSKVSAQYSSDISTKQNGGDLGYITVFTLPYLYESMAYSTAPGTFSTPFRSVIGYHIFKNVAERTPLGKRKISQILVAIPPSSSEAEKQLALSKADSVYGLLIAGKDFAEMAREVSNDISSAGNGGSLQEFGIGVYSPIFEKAAFSLAKPGELTKPFATGFGYHILKLDQVVQVGIDKANVETIARLQDKVQRDDRLAIAKKSMIDKQIKKIGYVAANYNKAELWKYTDSALLNTKLTKPAINDKTVVFSFAKQPVTVADWLNFVKASRSSSVETNRKAYGDLMEDFIKQSAAEFYRTHLENYSDEFKQQLSEFKDANLLFGIMDTNVWSKANNDTTGQKKYYEQHKSKYVWAPSAEALIVTSANEGMADEIQEKIKKSAANWHFIVESYGGQVTADSGRFEFGQLPVLERTRFEGGIVTAPVKSQGDNTVTFNYIFSVYNDGEQRTFDDSRGLVISDYQQVLEDKWIAELKKKYPVKVNMAVFNSIK